MSMSDELRSRLDDSPHRLAYYERTLNRIASEVGGNAKFQADRIAAIVEEIDAVRKEVGELRKSQETLVGRVDRIAEFLNTLKKNGGKA